MPSKYTRKADGAETVLEYDGDQTRVRKTTTVDETLYFGDYERVTPLAAPSSVEHRYAVWSDERVVAIVTQKNLQPAGVPGSRAYLHVDHLGSTEKVTDGAGAILERRSYDAFGARRNPDWTQKTLSSASRGTTRGYTGHEDDADVGLVNMKGRILDPRLARFLTTDPLVSYPRFSQSWNPYSYGLNSPLKYVDPTGFEPDPELVRIYGPGVEDTIVVVGERIPERDPSVDGRPPRDSGEVNRAGNRDSGAPQAYDSAGEPLKENAWVQGLGGAVSGVALGAVPGGGLAAQVATVGGVLDEGTRAARIGRSVGEMVGGIVCLLLGGAGEVGGGAASATGVGAFVGAPVMIGSAALVTGGAVNVAAGASGLVQALMSSGSGQYPRDKASGHTRDESGKYRSEREARAIARQKLGKDPVTIEPGKMRSQDGRWQYRAKPEDLTGHSPTDSRHIHLERLNPETGEVLYNLHMRW